MDDLSATGVVRNAVAIASRLLSAGWDVCIVSARATGMFKDRVPSGVAIRQLIEEPSDGLSRSGRLIRSFRSYRRFLKSFRPDVLLSAGNHGHLLSMLASGAVPECRTAVRISNDIDHRIRGKPDRNFAWMRRRLRLRFVAARADLMILVSPHLRDDPTIARAGKVVVIPNGVDSAAVRKRAREDCDQPWLAGTADQPVVLGVGRFVTQKNFSTLLQAIAIARQSRPMRLMLIGSGPLLDALRGEAERLGISDCVAMIAPLANPMPYFARAATVVISSWWEGSSNVLLEAMACGTPVVASRTAGNADQVLDGGRYGVLVDPADAEEMAAAILKQCSGLAVRPEGRASEFSVDETLDAYATVLAGLAAS